MRATSAVVAPFPALFAPEMAAPSGRPSTLNFPTRPAPVCCNHSEASSFTPESASVARASTSGAFSAWVSNNANSAAFRRPPRELVRKIIRLSSIESCKPRKVCHAA